MWLYYVELYQFQVFKVKELASILDGHCKVSAVNRVAARKATVAIN